MAIDHHALGWGTVFLTMRHNNGNEFAPYTMLDLGQIWSYRSKLGEIGNILIDIRSKLHQYDKCKLSLNLTQEERASTVRISHAFYAWPYALMGMHRALQRVG